MSSIKNILKLQNEHFSATMILKWLWKVSKGNRTQASLNAIIGVLEVLVSLACVWAMKFAIDKAQFHGSANEIYIAVAILASLYLLNMGLAICGVWIRNILGIKAQNRMQQSMLDRILHSQWSGKEKFHSGDILNRLELDVRNVISFITEVLPNILSVGILFIGAFCMLASLNIGLAFVIVAIIPVAIAFSRIYMNKMRSYTKAVRISDSKVQSLLQETIQHRMLIKTLEKDDAMIGRLDDTQSILRDQVRRKTKFSVASHFILNFGFLAGYLIAFLWGAIQLADGIITFGSMTAFLQLVNRIQNPARDIMKLAPQFVSVFTAAERLMELEDEQLEEQGDSIHFKSPCGIRFSQVDFRYEDNRAILHDFTFDFAPGTCTAIMGETGSGKTTLIRLILALLHPQKGNVCIYNAKKEAEISPRTRCNLVYVPQGNTLLSGTIRDNLYLGRLNATDEELYEVLHQACADFVSELPDGLDTKCGEGGTGLSEGQAQRIAIARALLREGSIVLLDEATSALDVETEKQLLHNIISPSTLQDAGKTVIFITHRQAITDYCDKVIRL